jgi:branched-chain amino acid transport system substrate-binding protein
MTVALINQDPPLGRPLKTISNDGESTAEGEIKAANYLGGQGVIFTAGYTSDGLWAALPVIERYGIPAFTQWSGSSRLDETPQGKARLLFRATASDTLMDAVYGLYWQDELAPQGYEKVAILSGTDEASRSTAIEAAKALEKAGAQVVSSIEFSEQQATFSRILADTFAEDPDAIFLGVSVEQGSILIKEWWDSALNKDVMWMVPDEWPGPQEALDAIQPVEGALDNKLVGPAPATGEELRQFVGESGDIFMSEYQKVYGAGAEPEHGFAVNMYDILVVASLAIVAAGEATPAAISAYVPQVSSPPGVKVHSYAEGKKALEEGKEIDFEGAGSLLNFDEYGNVYPSSTMIIIINSQWEHVMVYSPAEQADFLAK